MGGTALAPQHVIGVKPRTYRHLDSPLNERKRLAFSISAEEVQRHDFYPFVGFDQRQRRIDFDTEPYWKITTKNRPIRYAGHLDSAIHSYYASLLNAPYEHLLATEGLGSAVLAYRGGTGSNINFAKSLIDEVKRRGNCTVLCVDISGFFDNLDHHKLEAAILQVFGLSKLPKDWIKVFKRLTSYEWVDTDALRRAVPRSNEPHRLCSAQEFRTCIRPLIEINKTGKGIPQGSPLSGLFANVYMLSFDLRMNAALTAIGGSYRRYSDDIAIVVPRVTDLNLCEDILINELANHGLALNSTKTVTSHFHVHESRQVVTGECLQYLGFTFDGRAILLRSSSLKRFYAKMRASIRIAVRAAANAEYPVDEIRRRTLVGRYTHWGDRNNFIQYAYRSSAIMNSPAIRRQVRRHVSIFRSTFEKYKRVYFGAPAAAAS